MQFAGTAFASFGLRADAGHAHPRASADPSVRAGMLKAIPMRREGRIEEVANANLFLASDEASYITGIEVPVDGGYLAM